MIEVAGGVGDEWNEELPSTATRSSRLSFRLRPAVRIHSSFRAYSDVLADRVPCSAAVIISSQYRKGWSVHFPVYSLAHSGVHGIA